MTKIKIAIQMDAWESIKFDSDSTVLLAREAERRGCQLYYYQPKDLSLVQGKVLANMNELWLNNNSPLGYQLGERSLIALDSMDIILMRQDPPFDMNYLTATYLLDLVAPQTLIINNPAAVRSSPEKLIACHLSEYMPPTLITRSKEAILEFRREHQDIVMKPLYSHGGRGVFRITQDDDNFDNLIALYMELYNYQFIIQKYLPEIKKGDKRVIMLDGEVIGAITRVPAEGKILSNMVAGASALKTELTDRDHDICRQVGKELKQRGLFLAGIDIIGDYLTEINVTSPTGLKAINRLYDTRIEEKIWDYIFAQRNRDKKSL